MSLNMVKVAVLGAAGGIGQPLSLLLTRNKRITELALYDVVESVRGVAADLSHNDTPAQVNGYFSSAELSSAISGAQVIVIPAGVPRKPGMTRDDLFNTNASIVATLAQACAKEAPDACVAIISNPVNSTVPIAREVYKKFNAYNPKKLFGVTTLDSVRARKFVSELKNSDVLDTKVNVIGGHSGATIVPILSAVGFPADKRADLVQRIQFGGDEVVKAKNGSGSATLSMAHAGEKFVAALIKGLAGESNVVEPAFVEQNVEGCEFFATPVKLGKNGWESPTSVSELKLDEAENELLSACVADLKKNIQKGIEFGQAFKIDAKPSI